jgi:hypothetical protein
MEYKRINGTFFERFLVNYTLIYAIITALILLISGGFKDKFRIIFFSLIMTLVLLITILIDYIKIKLKLKLSKMKISDKIYIDNKLIDFNEIKSVTPIKILQQRWSLNIIEIEAINKNYFILDRPQMFWKLFVKKKSKSIKLIEVIYPLLKSKILDGKIIVEFPPKNKY